MLIVTYTPLFIILISFFFFNNTATTEIYTLSLHDALPIWPRACCGHRVACRTTSAGWSRSEEHTSELQSHSDLVCRLLLEKKKKPEHPANVACDDRTLTHQRLTDENALIKRLSSALIRLFL